jgi:hypothetical protein
VRKGRRCVRYRLVDLIAWQEDDYIPPIK